MTRDEIVSTAKSLLNIGSDDTTHDTYMADTFNNIIFPEVRNAVILIRESFYQTEYTQDITAGEDEYEVKNAGSPAITWQKIIAVKVLPVGSQNWYVVPYMPGLFDETEQSAATSYTNPNGYAFNGNKIKFDIIPAETITNGLKITAIPAPATVGASATPEIPPEYHFVLVYGLAFMLGQRIQDSRRGDFMQLYSRGLFDIRQGLYNRSQQTALIETYGFMD